MDKTIMNALTNEAKEQKVTALIADLAIEFKPFVDRIEKSFETTQNHYGSYVALIGQVARNEQDARLYCLAMVKAGGNKTGIYSALRVLYNS